MPDTNPNAVKLLSDDEVAEIEARANAATPRYCVDWEKGRHALLQDSGWRSASEEQPRTIATFDRENGYLDLLFCAEARTDIPALCATVRALRVVHVCGAVASGSAVGGCGNEVTTLEDFRCADCLAWFHRNCINEHFQLDAYVKKLRELREQGAIDDWKKSLADKEAENTALREQLAHWQDRTRERTGEVERLQSELAQREQEWKAFENLGKRVEADLRAQLAQVTQERLTDEERKVLADHHYYESEKAITRYGDKVGQRLHLERLAIFRGKE